MWWGGFSERHLYYAYVKTYYVLIPMWWGGFSEITIAETEVSVLGLNPHVVGRFFRVKLSADNPEFVAS